MDYRKELNSFFLCIIIVLVSPIVVVAVVAAAASASSMIVVLQVYKFNFRIFLCVLQVKDLPYCCLFDFVFVHFLPLRTQQIESVNPSFLVLKKVVALFKFISILAIINLLLKKFCFYFCLILFVHLYLSIFCLVAVARGTSNG